MNGWIISPNKRTIIDGAVPRGKFRAGSRACISRWLKTLERGYMSRVNPLLRRMIAQRWTSSENLYRTLNTLATFIKVVCTVENNSSKLCHRCSNFITRHLCRVLFPGGINLTEYHSSSMQTKVLNSWNELESKSRQWIIFPTDHLSCRKVSVL